MCVLSASAVRNSENMSSVYVPNPRRDGHTPPLRGVDGVDGWMGVRRPYIRIFYGGLVGSGSRFRRTHSGLRGTPLARNKPASCLDDMRLFSAMKASARPSRPSTLRPGPRSTSALAARNNQRCRFIQLSERRCCAPVWRNTSRMSRADSCGFAAITNQAYPGVSSKSLMLVT